MLVNKSEDRILGVRDVGQHYYRLIYVRAGKLRNSYVSIKKYKQDSAHSLSEDEVDLLFKYCNKSLEDQVMYLEERRRALVHSNTSTKRRLRVKRAKDFLALRRDCDDISRLKEILRILD